MKQKYFNSSFVNVNTRICSYLPYNSEIYDKTIDLTHSNICIAIIEELKRIYRGDYFEYENK